MVFYKISQYTIDCDECENMFVFDGYAQSEAISGARHDGWSIGKRHLCPKCRKLAHRPKVDTQ